MMGRDIRSAIVAIITLVVLWSSFYFITSLYRENRQMKHVETLAIIEDSNQLKKTFCPEYVKWRDLVESNYREVRSPFRVAFFESLCSP